MAVVPSYHSDHNQTHFGMPLPFVREAERHAFDPESPPGNPPTAQPYPTVFRPNSDHLTFTFTSPEEFDFFNDLQYHSQAVTSWNQLFDHFVQPAHMIHCIPPPSFGQMDSRHYNFRSYQDVDSEYRNAQGAAGELAMSADNQSDLDSSSLASVDTLAALRLVTRSARRADLCVRAVPTTRTKLFLPQALCYMVLCLAEIKALVLNLDFKYRIDIIGALCQSLRYLVYGNALYGTSFGFLAYGPHFRRSLIVDGSLYVDIGPVVGDGTRASVIQDMTMFDLLLHGMQDPMNPMDLGSTLTIESTTASDDGYAFVSYLRAMGQSWIQEMHTGGGMPFAEMRLGGTFARVDGFSLGLLSRACCEVETHLRNMYNQAQLETVEAFVSRDGKAHTGLQATPLSTQDPQDPQSGPDGSAIPPDTDDDDMRQKILEKASKGASLTSLRQIDPPSRFPGLSEANKAVLNSIALAAREGGVDIRAALGEIGG